jgi:hypothetical protein
VAAFQGTPLLEPVEYPVTVLVGMPIIVASSVAWQVGVQFILIRTEISAIDRRFARKMGMSRLEISLLIWSSSSINSISLFIGLPAGSRYFGTRFSLFEYSEIGISSMVMMSGRGKEFRTLRLECGRVRRPCCSARRPAVC